VNGVAAKIAEEVGVLLQDNYFHARPGQQVAGHHSSRSATDDQAARSAVIGRFHQPTLRSDIYKVDREKSV
jgi:hypothetical protein